MVIRDEVVYSLDLNKFATLFGSISKAVTFTDINRQERTQNRTFVIYRFGLITLTAKREIMEDYFVPKVSPLE